MCEQYPPEQHEPIALEALPGLKLQGSQSHPKSILQIYPESARSKRKAEKGSCGPAKEVPKHGNIAAGREEKQDYRDERRGDRGGRVSEPCRMRLARPLPLYCHCISFRSLATVLASLPLY